MGRNGCLDKLVHSDYDILLDTRAVGVGVELVRLSSVCKGRYTENICRAVCTSQSHLTLQHAM